MESQPYLDGQERLLETMRTTKHLHYAQRDAFNKLLLDTLLQDATPDNVSVELFLNEQKWDISPHPHLQGYILKVDQPEQSWPVGGTFPRTLLKRLSLKERQAMLKATYGRVYKLQSCHLQRAQEHPEESTLSPLELEDTIDELKRSYVRWIKWAGVA